MPGREEGEEGEPARNPGAPGSPDLPPAGPPPLRPSLESVRPVAKPRTTHPALVELGALLDPAAPPPDQRPVTRRDLAGADAFVLEHVLSPSQCRELVRRSEAARYTPWNAAAKTDYRSACTVEVLHPALAAYVWGRVRHLVPPAVRIAEGQRRWERDLGGEWRASAVNEHMLFARYGPGGHFSPHTDGYTIVDFNTRSLYSLLVYLNDCADGGRTRLFAHTAEGADVEYELDAGGRFRVPESRLVNSAPAAAGSCLAFFQDVPHEGEPVGPGAEKYLIRTDLMYRRDPPVCDSPQDVEAYRLFREAEIMEGDGDPMGALRLYQRAVRLSPALASVYGYG